ncbi:hypothetical protein CPG37_07005 [Malaciobacter canalis]|uniref:HTH cro/C1-type domain-containing protein n=1 Tax=Malaciobacter canalis TaxID=1912871 RepID=A0ABX4LPC8_9BACT|nr:hypothetical protein [Malaciobacter canalis]PHO09759.1 hypothetical protein CPG37_07005 [Malaciobacter canalis]QEE33374.1 hypothetical protein ACAN_1910 [Malaciobacter canalis]
MDALKILRQQIKEKSIGKVAKEMSVSKATVSLVNREKYPNPYKIYTKVKEIYGDVQTEIIGVENTKTIDELGKELGCT